LFDLAGGANYATGTGNLVTTSVYGGTGNDTLSFGSGVTTGIDRGRFGGAAGNDSISFGGITSSGASMIGGAGNDTLNFGGITSAAQISGGLGNDSILFAVNSTNLKTQEVGTYFYEGGTDTLSFSTGTTSAGVAINVNTLSGAYTSVTTDTTTGGIEVMGDSTRLIFISGFTDGGKVNLSTYTSTEYTNLTTLG
jgi:hypothetical protein